jgi:ATP-dependent helicase/nuclease subunit A
MIRAAKTREKLERGMGGRNWAPAPERRAPPRQQTVRASVVKPIGKSAFQTAAIVVRAPSCACMGFRPVVLDFTREDACATLACVRSLKSSRERNADGLTPAQRQAVAARGNVLVMAGAGTGKTRTLVERCLHCLCAERASLDEILVVTFTDAAAAEMRQRLRRELENRARENPDDAHWAAQLALFDTAHIGTVHSFCLKLVREHFYELGLDPQLSVLDEGEARRLAEETLDEELQAQYAGRNELAEAVQKMIQICGGGRDQTIRRLVLRLHDCAQTRPDADGWLARQIEQFAPTAPDEWREWLLAGVRDWRDEWLPALENLGTPASGTARSTRDELRAVPEAGAPSYNEKAAECLEILKKLPDEFSREQAVPVLTEIQAADENWPLRRKTALRRPLEKFFADAAFLNSLAPVENGRDPLAEDWDWVRGHLSALLRLTQNYSVRFAARKRDDGVLDFHDLEQFTLKLLWDFAANKPTPAASRWRGEIRFVFVDEYQDINAAQDKIIQALSRDGAEANRFLVGDVKQSIYRFRLADPKIFRDYAEAWHGQNGRTIPLAENFRSREGLLGFVNSVFELLMRGETGGVRYDAEARLQFGSPKDRTELSLAKNPSPRAELLLRFKPGRNDAEADDESGADDLAGMEETEKEARLLALRLKGLKAARHEIWDDGKKVFRAAEWRDLAVLLRSPANKAEAYAKEFERAGVPLVVERGGFYDAVEILDLLSLLQLLDNPLQDVPAIAVLRSPLVGLSLDELAAIRLAAPHGHFWTALNRSQNAECGMRNETVQKIRSFLDRFCRWRELARQASLSRCLESVLAETHYADWLKTRPRGAQRHANVGLFLNLAQHFDQFQRQGLFRFLRFVEAQREAEVEPEVAPIAAENAVRLMSIHQSKGLEFPVVAVADLAKPFNTQDLRAEIIFDESFGLCPRVQPPRHRASGRYPSLPHWLAQQRQRREQWGEELRLLYVAMTRARDTLVLTASIAVKKWETLWTKPGAVTPQAIMAAQSYADWLGLWFAQHSNGADKETTEGELPHLRWRIAVDAELAKEPATEKTGAKSERPELDKETRQKLRAALTWEYEFRAATNRKAKSSVTALRRQAAEELDDETEPVFPARSSARPARRDAKTKLSAAETGTAHHKFLQHLALENADDAAALEAEAGRLVREKVLSAAERAALDLEAVAAFWNSPAGRKIRGQAAQVRRELAFTAKFSPAELDEIIGAKSDAGLEGEFVVVQGVADLVVLLPKEIWLVDFKTDEIKPAELAEKKRLYAPQLKLYTRALSKIYARPVTACWLHFLSARKTMNVEAER